jgi:hypothetical protein
VALRAEATHRQRTGKLYHRYHREDTPWVAAEAGAVSTTLARTSESLQLVSVVGLTRHRLPAASQTGEQQKICKFYGLAAKEANVGFSACKVTNINISISININIIVNISININKSSRLITFRNARSGQKKMAPQVQVVFVLTADGITEEMKRSPLH